ncbi:hypothetical protein [Wolbachia endosymbiont (group B) of Celastrina argiolus]|nr:hypothetical protein [Wolbachia endosymbiont (group B) of Celastrina argiolus]
MNFENLKKILSAIDKDASVNKDNVIRGIAKGRYNSVSRVGK